jgi:hypothetical protein
VFGSLVAFTAYIWLLGVVSPSRASTYAYVNPLVAVVLGWALAGEALDARVALSAVVIVGAVAMIIAASREAEKARAPPRRTRRRSRRRRCPRPCRPCRAAGAGQPGSIVMRPGCL